MLELSQLYRHTAAPQCQFSSDSKLLLNSHHHLLVLRDTQSAQVIRTWKLPSASPAPAPPRPPAPSRAVQAPPKAPDTPVTVLSISPHAPYLILAFLAKSAVVHIFDPERDAPIARLDVGGEGAVGACWSGLGDAVLVWSKFQLRISIYRIDSPTTALHIHHPKLAPPFGYAFRPTDSLLMAVVERHDSRDHIGIYNCADWTLVQHFALVSADTDVADISWSPCGNYLAVWETYADYLFHVYTPGGRLVSTFAPYEKMFTLPPLLPSEPLGKSTLRQDDNDAIERDLNTAREIKERAKMLKSTDSFVGLGIRTVKWGPSGEYLAIGGWDGKIRVLCRTSWTPVAELSHPAKISSSSITVWREPTDWIEKSRGNGVVPFEAQELPYNSPSVRADPLKPNPVMGVAELGWADSGHWIASFNQTYPTSIWIFSFVSSSPTLNPYDEVQLRPVLHTVLIYNSPIKTFSWASIDGVAEIKDTLLVATGEKAFGIWTAPGSQPSTRVPAEGVGLSIPTATDFALGLIKISSDGRAFLLADRETFKVAYPE